GVRDAVAVHVLGGAHARVAVRAVLGRVREPRAVVHARRQAGRLALRLAAEEERILLAAAVGFGDQRFEAHPDLLQAHALRLTADVGELGRADLLAAGAERLHERRIT